MSFTTPIYIPLTKGLDLSKDAVLGEVGDLTLAQNVDFSIQGQVRGRPARGTVRQFIVRSPAGGNAYLAAQSLSASGFRPNGLMTLKDYTDERAMLGTDGRLFALEGTEWKDRGAFAAMRVDAPHSYFTHVTSTLDRRLVGPDFGCSSAELNQDGSLALLNPTSLGFERAANANVTSGSSIGTMARCGTVTATLYVPFLSNNLKLVTRSNGASSLVETTIATDAAGAGHDGDAMCICCDADQTSFFVVYQTTVANQYKVLKVTTAGAVTATYTGTLAGIWGHWVANSSVSANVVVVGLTNVDGFTMKVLNATTLVDNAKDSTYTVVGCDAREVVVGVDSATRAWWAFRANTTAAINQGLNVGTANPGTAASATRQLYYSSVSDDAARPSSGVGYYTPLHGFVRLGGRTYLTIAALNWVNVPTAASGVGTWFTLDLTNLKPSGYTDNGPFSKPTIVARGRTDAFALRGTSASQKTQPDGAVLLSDGTGWVFPSAEWRTYNLGSLGYLQGERAVQVLNRVVLSGPRAVVAGGTTLFSGSVPRSLAGDQCYEHGFPLVRPYLAASTTGGAGTLAAGSYTVYGCWMYVDGTGQVHRSAPTVSATLTAILNDAIDVYIQTPFFSERPDVKLEVYCTKVNPTPDDPPFLQAVVSPSTTGAGSTKARITSVTTGVGKLYTASSEFIHVTPSADGGIAALGRRVWVADRGSVYASLLLQPNKGIAWNDEGSLQVDLPAGAGRILALEGMEDKLVIFAEQGIWMVQDGGPDNVGDGPDITYPIKVSDLGIAGPRSSCATDRGVLFCTPLDATDPHRGGPWLLDRSLSLTDRKFLGPPALEYFRGNGSWVPEVAFSPERQQAYVTVPNADEESPANTGVVVIDYRMERWSTWSASDSFVGSLRSIEVVDGVLWDLRNEPCPYDQRPGQGGADFGDSVPLRIRTTHLASNGHDGLGWARVRGFSVLGADAGASYLMQPTIYQDQTRQTQLTGLIVQDPTFDTTWPSSRTAPEWRLPVQKCASLQVELWCGSHLPRWSAIRLEVQPLPGRAPASQRT